MLTLFIIAFILLLVAPRLLGFLLGVAFLFVIVIGILTGGAFFVTLGILLAIN